MCGGSWSGYPPHCHDGKFGSPYLEETYYYRISPDNGLLFTETMILTVILMSYLP